MSLSRIAVFCSGNGSNLQAVIDACERGEIPGEVVCVIYNRKAAYARIRAEIAGIPAIYINKKTLRSDEAFDRANIQALQKYAADIIVLAGYLAKLSPEIINNYTNRILNIHPSLIPAFCGTGMHGLHVHEAVMAYGAKVTGATVHLCDESYDSGPIVCQRAIDVLDDDTPESLQARVLTQVEHVLLPEAIRLLCEGRVKVEGRRVRIT